jgi:hypothetical protein
MTGRDDDFAAYPVNNDSYDKERFLKLMMQRGTTVSMTDALAVLNEIEETALYIIRNGGTISLPLFSTRFSITGVFDGPADNFDPLRHQLHVRVGKGSLLRNVEKSVTLSKVNISPALPLILEVIDS